jgi:dipeptidyl aminopeptidase/acylaminoacyl peptidase
VADSDGYNEQVVLAQDEPIMSPSWSPDGSHLAYVSFETGHASVFVQSLYTKQRKLLADFRGSNSAPAWSPDGRQLAVVLTRDGSSQIYLIRPDGGGLRRITFSGAIDTEPHFSPDGQYLLFTSDRGGSAQIYRMPVEGGAAERSGADVSRIDELLEQLGSGVDVPDALDACGAPEAATEFVGATWQVLASGQVHAVAAAFTFGREEVIPEMFRRLVDDLGRRFPGKLEQLQYYLKRHIELDEDSHGPLARRMLTHLCGDDGRRWKEATDAATHAIEARIALWNGVMAALPHD